MRMPSNFWKTKTLSKKVILIILSFYTHHDAQGRLRQLDVGERQHVQNGTEFFITVSLIPLFFFLNTKLYFNLVLFV